MLLLCVQIACVVVGLPSLAALVRLWGRGSLQLVLSWALAGVVKLALLEKVGHAAPQ